MRAKKSLGQNFLVDGALQHKIVEALGCSSSDTVLEIGSGGGASARALKIHGSEVPSWRRLLLEVSCSL